MRCCRSPLALLFVLLFITSHALAVAVVVARESTLRAAGQITGDQFDVTDAFTNFGLYDNSIGDTLTPTAGGTTSAQASQRSNVPASGFSGTATGSAAAQVAELDAIAASADSFFSLTFDITNQPETLVLGGRVASTFDASARVVVADQFETQTFFTRSVDTGAQDELTFNENVQLQPGRYRLIGQGSVTGTPSPNTADFDMSFRLSTTGTPIPLPLAAYPGAVALVAALIAARVSRLK